MEEKVNQHIHIGTGKFGLGFVGYFSHQFGFSTVFLNRKPRTESSAKRNSKLRDEKSYTIEYYDRNGEKNPIKFHDLHFFGRGLEETGSSVGFISDPRTILLTTAVGESQLQHIAPLIADGLQRRKETSPLFIIACENGHRCSQKLSEEVRKYLPSHKHGGIFADCVVDQICQDIKPLDDETNQSQNHVTVIAESYRQWVIEDVDERLTKLLNHKSIKFVPKSHIDLYELRKLWLVNGFQLATAVLGYRYRIGEISKVIVSTHPKLAQHIEGIKTELANAFIFKNQGIFTPEEVDTYIDRKSVV